MSWAVLLIAFLATPSVADEITAHQSANGHVVEIMKHQDDDYSVLVDGKKVFASNNDMPDLSIKGVWGNFVVIEGDSGGTACPAIYRAIDLSRSPPAVSDEMGNCSDIPRTSLTGNTLSMTFPQQSGPDMIVTFSNGKTSQINGEASSPPPAGLPETVKCTDPDMRNYVLGLMIDSIRAASTNVPITPFGGGKILYDLTDASDFEPVQSPPVDPAQPANTPMQTNTTSGGLLYDVTKIPGAIEPSHFALCRGTIIISVEMQNSQMPQPVSTAVQREIRFVVQPVENSTDYNITTYGLNQGIAAALASGLLRSAFGGR
jgi:hypothetical protein